MRSQEEWKLLHVLLKVGETHERGALVVGQVTAHTRWVAGSTCVKEHAELVVVDLVVVSANLAQVVLHSH